MIDVENNENDLMRNKKQLTVLEDDCDIIANNPNHLHFFKDGMREGNCSSRHNGTHELIPSLIMQQENKFNTITS